MFVKLNYQGFRTEYINETMYNIVIDTHFIHTNALLSSYRVSDYDLIF